MKNEQGHIDIRPGTIPHIKEGDRHPVPVVTHPWSEIERKIPPERLARIKAEVDKEASRIVDGASFGLPEGSSVEIAPVEPAPEPVDPLAPTETAGVPGQYSGTGVAPAPVHFIKAFLFRVRIEGIKRSSFSTVSRLHVFTSSERHREPLALTRGFVHNDVDLFAWTEQRKEEKEKRKDDAACARLVTVDVLSRDGEVIGSFEVGKCVPMEYYIGPFANDADEVLMETLVLDVLPEPKKKPSRKSSTEGTTEDV